MRFSPEIQRLVDAIERRGFRYPNAPRYSPVEPDRRKVARVMREYRRGELHASAGYRVTNPRQAIAIALSEGRRSRV